MSFSVVIPSKNAANLVPCVRAIREAGETCRIIVVDDGVDWATLSDYDPLWGVLDRIDGVKRFIFARNVNLGIAAAGTDDVIVLNDDALLKTTVGFSRLSAACRAWPDLGLIAASCDTVGNPNQFRRPGSDLIRDEPRMVCFVCVYIPRSTIDLVGGMDEEFGGLDERGQEIYGFCDDAYSYRVRQAGLKIGIYDGCYVDHASLESSFRHDKPRSLEPGQRLFIKKFGVDNWMQGREKSQWAHLFQPEGGK